MPDDASTRNSALRAGIGPFTYDARRPDRQWVPSNDFEAPNRVSGGKQWPQVGVTQCLSNLVREPGAVAGGGALLNERWQLIWRSEVACDDVESEFEPTLNTCASRLASSRRPRLMVRGRGFTASATTLG